MELKNIIKNLAKFKTVLLISVAIGIIAGILFFISPKKYVATGSLYIFRAADTIKFKYFAYEGYYAQQTGAAYTNNAISLLESTDIIFEALNKLNLPTDIAGLRKASRMIKVTKAGPQVITLSVTAENAETAGNLWNNITDITVKKSSSINVSGDQMIGISRVSNSPIIRNTYRPLWLCILSGALVVPLLAISFITLRSYSKWK